MVGGDVEFYARCAFTLWMAAGFLASDNAAVLRHLARHLRIGGDA